MFLAVQVFWAVTVSPVRAQDTSKSPLVVMGDKDYPPYESLVDGEPVGINVDLWREIAKILGRPLDLRLYQWADSQARVRRGEAKVLTFMSINKERAKLYDFTGPTFTSRFPVFVLAGKVDKFDVSDLTGKHIAVKKGGFPRTIVETIHPEAVIVIVESAHEGFRKLLRGEVDGVMEEERVGNTILRENDFHGIRATPKALALKTGHIAVVKGNPALLRQIDEALEAVKASGKFDQIAHDWAGLGMVLIKRETIRFVIVSGLAAIVLILSFGGVVYFLRMRTTNLALRKEITERKRAQEDLLRLGAAIEELDVNFTLFDADDRLVMCNKNFRDLIQPAVEIIMPGVTFEEITSAVVATGILPEAVGCEKEWVQERMERHRNPRGLVEIQWQDGIYLLMHEQRLPDGSTIIFSTDITARKRAEEALRESEARYRSLIDLSPDAIVAHCDGELVLVNPACARLFGAERPEEMIGKPALELAHPDFHEIVRGRMRQVRDDKVTIELVEEEFQRLDGSKFLAEVAAAPFEYKGRPAIQVVIRDITERKELEAQLREAQKLEALGQLTGGVAHEFNNLLQVIVASLGVIKHEVQGTDGADRTERMIELAQGSAFRGKELTGRLLSYVGKRLVRPEVVDVGEFVRNAVDLFKPTLGETIEIEVRLADDLWPIDVDREQLETAVLNLALNARDAMANGGRLTVEAANIHIDEALAAKHPYSVTPGGYVKVAITDTGTGMSQEVMDRVFDPFFTTKDVGKGTGLGLSMVYGFVRRQSGGFVDITSDEGRGTTVALYLPRADAEKAEASQPAEGSKEPSTGAATILVVEDEPAVLDAMVRLLEVLGYTALKAKDGAEALTVLEEGAPIDLLLADVILPGGMNGIELAETVRRAYPAAKLILMSGYPESELEARGLVDSSVRLLHKPFKEEELTSVIEEALGSGSEQVA